MKQRFLTVYDYGMGGCWQYFLAESEAELLGKYPQLTIVSEAPTWLKEASELNLREYDIQDEPDTFLEALAQERK